MDSNKPSEQPTTLPDPMDQIRYCLIQVMRFSYQLSTDLASCRTERVVQHRYCMGRLAILFSNLTLEQIEVITDYKNDGKPNHFYNHLRKQHMMNFTLRDHHIRHSTLTIMSGLSGSSRDDDLNEYGYAIGILQEAIEEDHHKWWKPIAPLLQTEDFVKVTEITQANAKIFIDNINLKMDWKTIHQYSRDMVMNLNAPMPDESFLKKP